MSDKIRTGHCPLCGEDLTGRLDALEQALGAPIDAVRITRALPSDHAHGPNPWDDDESERSARPVPDDVESCPLCGDDVAPGEVRVDSGVPWGHHHAHALCALENLAARVADLERVVVATAKARARAAGHPRFDLGSRDDE